MTVQDHQRRAEMVLCSHVSPVADRSSGVTMIGQSVADAPPNELVTNASIIRLL